DRQGRAIPVLARLQAVRWAGEPAILLSVRPADEGMPQPAPSMKPAEPEPLEGPFSPQELSNIVNLSSDGIVVVGEDGRITALNDRAAELLGRYVSEVAGKPFESLFAGESRSVAADYLDGVRYHGIASVLGDGRKVRAKLPNGEELPLFLTMGQMSADRKRRFCAILRDLSQWTRAEAEHVRARKAAEAASAHKSDLLARISHEIRTPLNSIIGFSEVMLEARFGNIGSDRYRDYVRDIHASGKHLMGLVNDLLDLSKVEAGKLELNFTRLDVNDLVLQCVRLMQPEANKGRIIMRSSLAQALPAVVADHRSLRQILLNLLSNAVKFTLPGGQVVVSTTLSDEGEVLIRVRDTGVGMEEKEIAVALEPFRQVASTANGRTPGTGLGLPLTKALAEVNRAQFRIESAKGEGTLTEITFPSQRVLPD
ncbi:MAG TPA: ATP-binding protein, partial [Hyphomicrobiales bacterium]|nr:ATP-binding protein [Hyphomicrobiales bacterium]